jgi:hypothetical protein
MYIRMTIQAVSSGIPESEYVVTFPAIDDFMLPSQFKTGIVMIELHISRVHLPVYGSMALRTINLESSPMRGCLGLNIK